MARMFEAECIRDTVQDIPYQRFEAGKIYVISEDCPVKIHFKRIQELDAKEADRVAEEGPPPPRLAKTKK